MFPHSHRRFCTRVIISALGCSLLLSGVAQVLQGKSVPTFPVSSFPKTDPSSSVVFDRQPDKDQLKDTGSTGVPDQKTSQVRVIDAFSERPLAFELNQGQTNKQASFLARGTGYNLFLTQSGFVLTVNRTAKKVGTKGRRQMSSALTDFTNRPRSELQNVVRMQFLGGNPEAKIKGTEELPGKSNYYIGNDPKKWLRDISNYSRLRHEDVYPGVDVTYHSNKRQLQ